MRARLWWALCLASALVCMVMLGGLALWPFESWWWTTPALAVSVVVLALSAVKAQQRT